jgi:hypothetical protein
VLKRCVFSLQLSDAELCCMETTLGAKESHSLLAVGASNGDVIVTHPSASLQHPLDDDAAQTMRASAFPSPPCKRVGLR